MKPSRSAFLIALLAPLSVIFAGISIQAEDAATRTDAEVSVAHAGYTGTGYLDMGGQGSAAQWNNVTVTSGGTHTLAIRYANNSSQSRSCELLVNGVSRGTIDLPPFGKEWIHWTTSRSLSIPLNAGPNTIRLVAATSAGGPNIDRLDIDGGRIIEALGQFKSQLRRIVFTKHFDMGASFYAYTEALSNAAGERSFVPGSALCLLTLNDDLSVTLDTLLSSATGVIRDPEVSFDGERILFAWKKSDRQDDYHLYEMEVATRSVRQLTFGLGYADYEGCYLPNGDIIFSSTRCAQIVDCWWTEVSNLYTCDRDGKYLRRLGFDQVHTNFPHLTSDGIVTYTRWEYNDRGQIYPQSLFQMYPDGTQQTALYGNNSYFPTTIMHAREIPNSLGKLVAIFSGHHTKQRGKLGLIDPAKGREENTGATLIAPLRATEAARLDAYGQDGDQWQYPYPLDERHFLAGFRPAGAAYFGIYLTDIDGNSHLLIDDPAISCNQAVPLTSRPVPVMPTGSVDYRKTTGTFTMENIYHGPGLQGVPKGTIRKLRVVALQYRAAGIGKARQHGITGSGLSCSPVGLNNASWDTKIVLGEADVYSDGSAAFEVPARTPLYFQAIDSNGHVVQTMRSWSTLQPGERFGCFGCHEDKNEAVPITGISEATRAGVQPLRPFLDVPPDSGFSYVRRIQPIWDRRCTQCHHATHASLNLLAVPRSYGAGTSLITGSHKYWSNSYIQLVDSNQQVITDNEVRTKLISWLSPQSVPALLPAGIAGSLRSPLFAKIRAHAQPIGITADELATIACWIDLVVPHDGEYDESMNSADKELYAAGQHKRDIWERQEAINIQEFIAARQTTAAHPPKWRHAENTRLTGDSRVRVHLAAATCILTLPAVHLQEAGAVEVYSASGRLIGSMPLEHSRHSGTASAAWKGPLGTGIYFVKCAGAPAATGMRVAVFSR